ncbi:MAG: beta-lactamase family protein [bacterium]|nr:beta-lactamase family protein [bacterium]MCM1373892.1 beta-lactamase family protein [Muribaculum sp.]
MYDYRQAIDRIMRREVDEGQIAGAAYLLIQGGRERYFSACGYADRERETPIRRDTIFRLFSMTKPITAVAVMLLVERGELDLRDAVSRYLPSFEKMTVWNPDGAPLPAEREITVYDLLNMTSGIPYPENWEGCSASGLLMDDLFRELKAAQAAGQRLFTREWIDRIARVPLAFQPGERWMYGLSADVLGAVIEVVTGKRYGDFLREEIFAPLEMKDTGFFVPEDKRHRFAQNYYWNEEKRALEVYEGCNLGEYYGEDVSFESGGAGLVSTMEDYAHFAQMLLQGGVYGTTRILGEKTVRFMRQDRLSPRQKEPFAWDSNLGCGYGCLMRVLTDQGAAGTVGSLGEYGWDGWTGNYMTIDPEDDMVMLYFIQRCGYSSTSALRRLRNVTYGALERLEN